MQSALISRIELEDNEAAFTVAIVPFASHENELFLIVGTAKETYLAPRTCRQAYILTYKIAKDGRGIDLLHRVSWLTSYFLRDELMQPYRRKWMTFLQP